MRWLLLIVIFAGMGLFIWRMVEGTPHVEVVLLSDAKSNWQSNVFTCPRGANFYLVFGVPQGATSTTENVIGTVAVLSDETLVAEIPFDAKQSTVASWLSKQQLEAYVLNWPTNATPTRLDGRLIPGRDYRVKLNFQSPPEIGSVWLVFTQTARDRRKP
ncbi:MAG: hypothetical protein KIS67_28830 [Verrucomicrobiae bacterium]|nr:hypothetical protein [Verrucomicrobiae bacterium]